MLTLQYTNRDYTAVFNKIKELMTTIEPRAEVSLDSANVESTIAKIIAGCFDSLSYNQDANILEAFPSTSRDARAIFDLLSIVGYTPKTARGCKIYLTLWNPSYLGTVTYKPFTSLQISGKTFYCPDEFSCAQGMIRSVEFYQGALTAPDLKSNTNSHNFIDNYYPNLSTSTIKQDMYQLPSSHTNIDSRTIRIYTPDGVALTYVENPYLVYTTKSSFSILPTVNSTGYSLIFSKDVSSGLVADNYYYFYLQSEGYDVGNNQTIDFTNFNKNGETPNFSYSYVQEASKKPETANEARESIALEFGWRDTPKAIVTKYDAERAILQNSAFVAAVDVRDGNDYSLANPDLLDVQVFIKVTEDTEVQLNNATVTSLINLIDAYLNKFKMLPLTYTIHVDDIKITEDEVVTEMYYWYPNITIYLKEQVNSQDASAILTAVYSALAERYQYKNTDFNQVPRIVDIIETVQNASDMILYLDIDGVKYYYTTGEGANLVLNYVEKEIITCSYTDSIDTKNIEGNVLEATLNTTGIEGKTRRIQYHTVKIVDANNTTIGFDSGGTADSRDTGTILSENTYVDTGTIDYTTGKLQVKLNMLPPGDKVYIYYKQETPTYCKFSDISAQNIRIALESIKE